MSSFTMLMLEEGVEVELPMDLSGIISILDQEVPYFSCKGYGYKVNPGKAILGKRWDLMIESVNHSNREAAPVAVGRVELEKLDDNFVQLRIPPRAQQTVQVNNEIDLSGQIFGSFVFQTLNTLQRHNLIQLPGPLPTI